MNFPEMATNYTVDSCKSNIPEFNYGRTALKVDGMD